MSGLVIVGALAGCSDADDGSTGAPPSTPTHTSMTPSRTPPTGSNGEVHVDMTDGLQFDPKSVTVAVGDTVTWTTTGAVPHSVTAYEDDLPEGAAYFASGEFESESAARGGYPDGAVAEGESYRHTFETTGEYPYFCIPHESGMKGTVVVE